MYTTYGSLSLHSITGESIINTFSDTFTVCNFMTATGVLNLLSSEVCRQETNKQRQYCLTIVSKHCVVVIFYCIVDALPEL